MTIVATDHVTQRIITNAFHSICDEMGHTMVRTANSSLFVEGRDFSCAIVDRNAELIAAANYDPSHLSAVALTVEFTLLYFGPDTVCPGDVYLVNDPFRGGGHLPDITLIKPVFAEGALLGFAVNRAHHLDIGGMAVAGFAGTARSVFQEGLRIPPVRWFDKGVEIHSIMDLITLNVRFPKDQRGDFSAQLASTHTAERRLLRLAQRYGGASVLAAMEESKNHAEQLTRLVIRDLPDGRYEFQEFIEDEGVTDQPYLINVAVTVQGDRLVVDYSGTSPQAAGPINSSYGNTVSATFNALLQLLGPNIPFNHGCFRPVEILAPRGCLLNPVAPAPCFGGVTEVSIRIVDAVLGALAPIAQDRTGAGSYGTCINVSGGGFDPYRGRNYGFYFFIEGGWGAASWRDGWNCTPNPTSNFNDYPVEWIETTLPVRYIEARLNTDSGGPGRWRGGVGTVRTMQLLAGSVEINGLGERFLIPAYGLGGGDPGGRNALQFRPSGDGHWATVSELAGAPSPSKFYGVRPDNGSWFRLVSGGGGGYGPALERPPELVVEDVRQGYVSARGACEDYGVIVASGDDGVLTVDTVRTQQLRDQMSSVARTRQTEYAQLIGRALERVSSIVLSEQAKAEIHAIEERLVSAAEAIALRRAQSDSSSPTWNVLSNPFLNERALKYWGSDSFDEWTTRNSRGRP